MSSSRAGAVPDAWDDDWTNNTATAAGAVTASSPAPAAVAKLSKAERRAQHAAQQKQLWDSADNPGRHLWLEAQGAVVPNRQELKPQVMTLLSRKPPPSIARRGGAAAGDEDEDSEEEARRKQAADMEERQRRAKLEHEDKQRRYAEARERIMGSPAAAASTGGSSGTAANSRETSQQGRRGGQQRPRNNNFPRRSQPGSPAEQSPARTGAHERPQQQQLFDPDGAGRRLLPRRENSDVAASRDAQPLRQPRGPESSGRGGFGFAPRGGRAMA